MPLHWRHQPATQFGTTISTPLVHKIQGQYKKTFSILLLIHRADAIATFVQDPSLADAKLPIDNPQLFPSPESDRSFFDDFYAKQWMFCVENLVYEDIHNPVRWKAEKILPFTIAARLGSGISSKVHRIDVYEEYNRLHDRTGRVCCRPMK
jgi:hypothetical protein